MKLYRKIAKALMKKNKGLTIGIFLMSVVMIVVGILGSNINASTTASVKSFIASSNLPSKVYTTSFLPASKKEELMSIKGIDEVNYRFIADSNFEIEQDGIFSGLVISYDENDLNKITFIDEVDVDSDLVKSYLPVGFANRHNVEAGDKLTFFINDLKIETVIKGIVSSPEVMYGDKDFMAVHEGYSYTKLFIDVNDLSKVININEKVNQWLLYFSSSLSTKEIDGVMSQVEDIFKKENIYSITDFERKTNNLLSLKPNLDAVNQLGLFFAFLICFITLGFNFIFIQIIIRKEKKTIGLLKSLGYKRKNIVGLFCMFTSLINGPAIVLGFPLSYLVLRVTLLKMESSFFLPLSIVSMSPLSICIFLITTFLIGLLSSFLSSSQIGKIEPNEAYVRSEDLGREPIKVLKHIKGSKFSKISLSSMFRSLGRQIVGSLCISACILFMFVSMEGYASNSRVKKAGYGSNFTYDCMIRGLDEEGYENIKSSISSISLLEPYIFIDGETNVGGKRIIAIKEGNSLTTPLDSMNKPIFPGNGIVIDQFTASSNDLNIGDSILIFGKEVKVSGIAIEYLSPISFISFDTASYLGFNNINGAMVKLKENESLADFSRDAYSLDSNIYVVKIEDQSAYSNDKYTPIAVALVILGSLSFLIGIILIINISFIDFLELRSKYATLRALGVPMKQISKIPLFENLFRCLFGILLSLPLCFFSAKLLFKLISSSSAYYAMVNFPLYFVLSASICIVYLCISVLISYVAIKRLDFAHYLNSRE